MCVGGFWDPLDKSTAPRVSKSTLCLGRDVTLRHLRERAGHGHDPWEGLRGSAQSRARALCRSRCCDCCCLERSRCRDFISLVILFHRLILTPTSPTGQHARNRSPAGGTVRQPDRSQGERHHRHNHPNIKEQAHCSSISGDGHSSDVRGVRMVMV